MSGASRLPVLMYHAVGPYTGPLHAELHVSRERFSAQLRWLTDHGFTGIAPRQCAAWLLRGEPLPERAVLLTFDDAYADLTAHALPEVVRHGFSAGVYVCTRMLGQRAPWDGAPLMGADDVQAWSREGIEFGAHSRTHPHLTSLASDDTLSDEVEGSARDLESLLGARAESFAYPYGDHDRRVANAVGSVASISFTVHEGLATQATDPLRIPRTMVRPDDGAIDMRMRTLLGRNPVYEVRGRVKRLWALGQQLLEHPQRRAGEGLF